MSAGISLAWAPAGITALTMPVSPLTRALDALLASDASAKVPELLSVARQAKRHRGRCNGRRRDDRGACRCMAAQKRRALT